MSGLHDREDASIPLLNEVMVAGNPLRAHNVAEAKSATAAAVKAAVAEPEGLFAHDADALVERLRGRCLTWLTGEGGVDTLVELGAGKVLTGLAKRIAPGTTSFALQTPADIDEFVTAIAG